jgi:hypothetical protein
MLEKVKIARNSLCIECLYVSKFRPERMVKIGLCTSHRLYSHHNEENRHNRTPKKEKKSSHWLLYVLKVSEGGKNCTNRLEFLRNRPNILREVRIKILHNTGVEVTIFSMN